MSQPRDPRTDPRDCQVARLLPDYRPRDPRTFPVEGDVWLKDGRTWEVFSAGEDWVKRRREGVTNLYTQESIGSFQSWSRDAEIVRQA